uniref:Helitron_like_N domain-containing protein n=3 Tax=Caenorhabditis tropicalis TaxID=1561998 RepID=A0A1I7T7M1_9PELO
MEADLKEELLRNFTIIQTEMYDEQYCTAYNLLEATEEFRDDGLEPVTLATHATSDMMKTLEKMVPMYDGPISVGMFIDYHSAKVLEYLQQLHRCDEEFRSKMTVHFAFRLSAFQTSCPTVYIPKSNESCWSFKSNQYYHRKNITGPFQLYPSNLMRNMARHGAKSDIHFLMDADMIVSHDFARKVKKIANEIIDGKNKDVLVVRRFESSNGTQIPRNHRELEQAMSLNKDMNWEVQVILHRNDLYNAAYFPSRIKVMHSLIFALCRANYTFNVLSHVFNVHEGVKIDNTIYSKATLGHQFAYARKTAEKRYINEMNDKYPETEEKCGVFSMV